MAYSSSRVKSPDIILIILVSLIVIYGLIALNQATLWAGPSYILKQIIWIGISIVAIFFVTFLLRISSLTSFSYFFYFTTILFLLMPFIPGLSAGASHRWVDLKIFRAQPSDIAKLGLIFFLARYLSNRYSIFDSLKRHYFKFISRETRLSVLPPLERRKINDPLIIIECFIITLIPFFLILAEPDLGTAIVFLFILLSILFFAGMELSNLIYLISPTLSIFFSIYLVANDYSIVGWIMITVLMLLISLSFFIFKSRLMKISIVILINIIMVTMGPVIWKYVLKEYQKRRIEIFFNPADDPSGSGWHILQSKIAIGSGKLWGEGVLNLDARELAFLPEQHTDFIFSVIAKKGGFIGAMILLIFYMLFLRRIFYLSTKIKNENLYLIIVGIGTLFGFQIIVNISMTLGALPVVGISLPFISYGGSSMLMSFILLGFLLNISRRRK